MKPNPSSRLSIALFLAVTTSACASAAPFSVPTPGLDALQQEEPYLYAAPTQAMDALDGTPLRGRVANLIATYEEELARAEEAQGGFLNTTLSILGLVLPLAGTASAVALEDPDQIQTVAIVTGAAATATMALNLLLKPQAKSAAAAGCGSFLESALESLRRQWDPPQRTSISGTPEEWSTYLTMRATLDFGRVAACGS